MEIFLMTGLTLLLYIIGKVLRNHYPILLFHPLIFTPILIIATIFLLRIDVGTYQRGTGVLTHFLAPATIAFAIPIYKYLPVIKKNINVLLVSVFSGSLFAVMTTYLLSVIFRLSPHFLISLLPRSITTPLAIEVSNEIGGVEALTIVFVIITGILGALISPYIFKLFKIESKVARGLALGMSAHAVGTNKALEYGEEAVTFSTLAMIFAGVVTIILGITLLPLFI